MKRNWCIYLFLAAQLYFSSCASTEGKDEKVTETISQIEEKETIKNGYYEVRYDNGLLWSTSEYKDGIRHGKTTSYYPNGQLRYLGFYRDGKKADNWLIYAEDGSFIEEINYDLPK